MKERPTNFVSTRCSALDRILGGGLPRGQITLVYGASNTGKTSLAIQCAVGCARENLRVLFVDADDTFSPARLSQIAYYNLDSVSPLLVLFKPQNFREQCALVENLDSYLSKNVALVIIDTITSLYRVELGGEEETFVLNRELNRQLAYLKQTAKTQDVAVLLTSQVRSVIAGERAVERIEPVATRVLTFWSQNILNLKVAPRPRVREAFLEKHFGRERKGIHCLFMLTETGVTDMER